MVLSSYRQENAGSTKGRRVMVKEESKALVVELSDPELTFFALLSFCFLSGRDCSLLTFVMFSVPNAGVSTQQTFILL